MNLCFARDVDSNRSLLFEPIIMRISITPNLNYFPLTFVVKKASE